MRKHPEKYGVKHFIKFGDYNVGRDDNLLTLPTYMQFLLDLTPEKIVLELIDISGDSPCGRAMYEASGFSEMRDMMLLTYGK